MDELQEQNDVNKEEATQVAEAEVADTAVEEAVEASDSDVSEASDASSEEFAQAEDSGESSESVDDGRQWYIVQTYTSQESKVQLRIEELIEKGLVVDKVFRVLVPEEETIEVKNNKRIEKVNKIYPGYVFVEMIMSDDTYYQIKSLAGVLKFVGSKFAPTPVTEDEILRVLRKVGDSTPKLDFDFELDEVIKVISGPFRGYSGPISEINVDKGSLKALISIFGRETPVTLDFDQVEHAVE